ncbi:MAG: FtsK/SpoIIIE domain-containing protein [Acidimicrobiia bacterium]|nr:FtsK/SpoIIIE domain-containing protein [Acidimicrobiia bacterium]
MHISLISGLATTDLLVEGLTAEAKLSDVLAGFGISPAKGVSIDGRSVTADAVADQVLYEGAQLAVSVTDDHPAARPLYELHATLGPPAGHVWKLAAGRYRMGPPAAQIGWQDGPMDAIELIVREDEIRIDGARVPVDQDVRIGNAWFRLRPAVASELETHGATTFNRPPRVLAPPTLPALTVPSRTRELGKPRRLSIVALILPAMFGVAMALVFNRIMFLAFALMGPLMMIGNTVDDQLRRKRDRADNEAAFAAEIVQFRHHVSNLVERDRIRRIRAFPSPANLLSQVDAGTPNIWERRRHHHDFMRIAVGIGDLAWESGLRPDEPVEPEVRDIIASTAVMRGVPVDLELGTGSVVGVYGRPRSELMAAVRAWLCSAAAQHGPADLRVAVLTDNAARWDWAKWLPHVRANDGELRLLASTPQQIGAILGFLRTRPDPDTQAPLTLLVSDLAGEDQELRTIHREVIAGAGMPVTAIVMRERRNDLPGACTRLVQVDQDQAQLMNPSQGSRPAPVALWTSTVTAARESARRLARFDDPESLSATSTLPDSVPLLAALGLRETTAVEILDRWHNAAPATLRAPIGGVQCGTLEIDLVTDGPHGLVAGTTGSGKSELLRTLVASLAATYDPEHLNFVLIDYKGGSAFDACGRLPHVVGVVTDLDEHLGARALTCLEAELRYREERLRSAGASDIREYGAVEGVDALPRVVLIVDEFAALAAELPDFMNALVDIAQRGRSLGVHMILATQRPSGVVKDSIRANTNLRISLRVQTAADSRDVLADPIASRISRTRPGRAYLRLGPHELVPFQSAISTLPHVERDQPRIRLTPFVFSMRDPRPPTRPTASGPTDLELLVTAIEQANRQAGFAPARRPWPDPLPDVLTPDDLAAFETPSGFMIGMKDEPDLQRQSPFCWDPTRDGNLLLMGSNGPADALRAIAAGIAARHPDEAHIYAIDYGVGALSVLDELLHTGAVIAARDRERQQRLLRMLQAEISHRRASRIAPTDVFLLIDGLAGFRATFDEMTDHEHREALNQIMADGPAVGVYTAIGATQARTVPGAMLGLLGSRLVFQVADRMDYSALGVTVRAVPGLGAGRALDVGTGRFVQIIRYTDEEVVHRAVGVGPDRCAPPVESLADTIKLADLMHTAHGTVNRVTLPVGIADIDLNPATLDLEAGDHALITGTPRSGKSTALAAMAAAMRHVDPECEIIAVCPRPSALREEPAVCHSLADVGALDGLLEMTTGRVLLLIDDADEVDDPDGVIETFMRSRQAGHHLIAAARSDALRGLLRHWTKTLRAARRGMVLCPLDGSDGEPLGARLPRTLPATMPEGRGYFCNNGQLSLVQTPIP